MDLIKAIMPVVASPALQAILNFAGLLNLAPLAHWEWNDNNAHPITYVLTTAAAAVASLWPARSNRSKLLLIVFPLCFLILAWITYTWVSTTPPRLNGLLWFDAAGWASFFLTYLSFGFLVARVVLHFAKR